MPETNYFVCTLGQAASINAQRPHQFSNINEFLDKQAQAIPDAPAVGFPLPLREDSCRQWGQKLISPCEMASPSRQYVLRITTGFGDLHRGSIVISGHLSRLICPQSPSNIDSPRPESLPRAVALLCPSSADFLFVWLGLMRKGHSVLLLACVCPGANT